MDRLVNTILTKLDGVEELHNIFVIAMTNRKDLLDKALLRPGRLEVHIPIGLPDFEGRKQIFRIHTNNLQTNNMISKNVRMDELSMHTDNFTGAEIEAIVKNAGTRAVHEQLVFKKETIKETDILVEMRHFIDAIKEIEPVFGNVSKIVDSMLPEKYLTLSNSHSKAYHDINLFLSTKINLKTILITGKNGCGKTILAFKIASDKKIKYTKIIRPIDTIAMDELSKSNSIVEIITGTHIVEESLIIIDDLKIIMNYVHTNMFSNKLYQTLLTLLKTPPSNQNNKLSIIIICSNMDLVKLIEKYMDLLVVIEK